MTKKFEIVSHWCVHPNSSKVNSNWERKWNWWRFFGLLLERGPPTFLVISFDDLDLISPRTQHSMLISKGKIDKSLTQVRCEIERCPNTQWLEDVFLTREFLESKATPKRNPTRTVLMIGLILFRRENPGHRSSIHSKLWWNECIIMIEINEWCNIQSVPGSDFNGMPGSPRWLDKKILNPDSDIKTNSY